MHERVLAEFFKGRASANELVADIAESAKRVNEIESHIEIEDMAGEFVVKPEMVVSLCDTVLSGGLPAEALETIGFALMASDTFTWDSDQNEVLGEVIADWSAPEVNLPLTLDNIRRFRSWLTREEPYPAKPARTTRIPRLVSLRRKISF